MLAQACHNKSFQFSFSIEEYVVISETNFLWILYGPPKIPFNPFKLINGFKEFVYTRRFDFVAKLGFDVVYHARKHCESLTIVERGKVGCMKCIGQVAVVGYR